jgi:hypothetical protein
MISARPPSPTSSTALSGVEPSCLSRALFRPVIQLPIGFPPGRRPQHFDYKGLHATIRIAHGLKMLVVTEARAAMIRATYEQRGEFSAAVELHQLFPGIGDIGQARRCERTIAG